MISSLHVGKAIYSILKASGLTKVYPIVADEGTTFPFIVYRRSSLTPASTKDRYNYQEIATVELIVAADNYSESIELAERVKQTLEHTRGTYIDINIGDIALISADEDYIENTFIQKLNFKITII